MMRALDFTARIFVFFLVVMLSFVHLLINECYAFVTLGTRWLLLTTRLFIYPT